VLAKTAQKHDYPSATWRRSYARRTGAERGFATTKDPATSTIARGWCRLMGLAPLTLFVTTLLIARNQRILAAWNTRQEQTSAAQPPGSPRKPANGAARPPPPGRPDPHPPRPPAPRPTPPARTSRDSTPWHATNRNQAPEDRHRNTREGVRHECRFAGLVLVAA